MNVLSIHNGKLKWLVYDDELYPTNLEGNNYKFFNWNYDNNGSFYFFYNDEITNNDALSLFEKHIKQYYVDVYENNMKKLKENCMSCLNCFKKE